MLNTLPIDPAEGAQPSIAAKATGTVIRVAVNDPDVALVLDAQFDRLVLERSIDSGITWQEVGAPSGRPALEREQVDYVLWDRAGHEDYLYRTRYYSSARGEFGQAGTAVEGAGLAIRNLLSVAEVKQRYFFGLDLTNAQGQEIPEQVWQHYILKGLRWFERQTDIPILPTTFCDVHDYDSSARDFYQFIPLDNYPVISVEEFRVQYPSGQSVVVFPNEWIRLNAPEGHIQIVPTAGTLSDMLVGRGGAYLPAVYGGLQYLPQLYAIEYTAGFPEGQVPRDIIDMIGMAASLGPLHLLGDLIAGAGIATLSLSMDGLSQSIGTTSSATNSGFGARTINYLKELKDQIPKVRSYYKRVGGLVVA